MIDTGIHQLFHLVLRLTKIFSTNIIPCYLSDRYMRSRVYLALHFQGAILKLT